MATGDLEGNLERLRVQLRTIGYPHPLDMNGLREGNPASILPLLHYTLLGYSRHVARYLSENGYALFAKSDLRFVECTLKYLRGEHAYRCPLTVAQILSHGFAERKFLLVYDVIQVCKRKHSELVKQARQAQQARKSIKRNTTLRDIVKNIDVANLDSLCLDEALSTTLEKVSQAHGHAIDIFTSDLKQESAFEKKKDSELIRQAQIMDPQSKLEQKIHDKKETVVREIEMGGKAKLTFLERQALYLGQAIPSRNLIGLKTPSSYNSLQIYFPQTQFAKSMGGLYNHHEQLSTEKLIATVKARCNKTKELLLDTQWIGPT